MASFAASLLDELMGRNRNANPDEKRNEPHWSDSEVCKMYLCGFCPHQLFTNTRSDLGYCTKIHDDELIRKYKASSRYMRMGYEEEYLTNLQTLIGEVDRKIRRGHQRLALNQAHSTNSSQIGDHQEKLKLLSDRINDLVEQAEKLGCEGKVEEAQGVLKLCDQLKDERTLLQESSSNQMTPKEMEVCPICGSFLVVNDVPQRVEEHITGKQHVGYAKVRDAIDDMKKKLCGDDPERIERLEREREERDQQKERERQERERQEQEKERQDNERQDKERASAKQEVTESHSRSRSHHSSKRSRSRSRDRHHRSRSREHRSHGHERRSRSRDREHTRHQRHHSNSRNSHRDRDRR